MLTLSQDTWRQEWILCWGVHILLFSFVGVAGGVNKERYVGDMKVLSIWSVVSRPGERMWMDGWWDRAQGVWQNHIKGVWVGIYIYWKGLENSQVKQNTNVKTKESISPSYCCLSRTSELAYKRGAFLKIRNRRKPPHVIILYTKHMHFLFYPRYTQKARNLRCPCKKVWTKTISLCIWHWTMWL